MKEPSMGRGSAPRDPRERRDGERPHEPPERRDGERPHEPPERRGSELPRYPGKHRGSELPRDPGKHRGSELPRDPSERRGSEPPRDPGERRGDESPLHLRDVDAFRAAALESAVEAATRSKVPKQQPRRSLERAMRHQIFEAARFLYAIVETGECLRAALDFAREPALRLDRYSQLLAAIDKAGGCPSFSYLGRALRVSRQAAREIVLAAERAGSVELFADPFDRRSLQVGLTPLGRRELERRRFPAGDWTLTLLNGLPPQAMRRTAHVLGVIRERLRRYEQDLKPR